MFKFLFLLLIVSIISCKEVECQKIKCLATGNEYISIPTIRQNDAGIEKINFILMRYNGLIELSGDGNSPFIMPYIEVNNKCINIKNPKWIRDKFWIPNYNLEYQNIEIKGIIFTPVNERGLVYQLQLTNKSNSSLDLFAGIGVSWNNTYLTIYSHKQIIGNKKVIKPTWLNGIVIEFYTEVPTFAIAFGTEENKLLKIIPKEIFENGNDEKLNFIIGMEIKKLKPNEKNIINIYIGIGLEEYGAVTSVIQMRRNTYESIYNNTIKWLSDRTVISGDDYLDNIVNINYFYNHFFTTGYALDTDEIVLITSRSSRYYVSSAYWDRDAMIWSFLPILERDKKYARKMLEYSFMRQIHNVGIHSRYINGTILEPGFELDELCAPVIALSKYIEKTNDMELLEEKYIQKGLNYIIEILETKKHPVKNLYKTMLGPSDDFEKYPYLTYCNVLVFKMLLDYSKLFKLIDKIDLSKKYENMAYEVRNDILSNCIVEGPFGKMFAWSVDLNGNYILNDEPAGSLKLLPYYSFCNIDDTIYQNTVKWIHSEYNIYSFSKSPLSEIGCLILIILGF